MITVSILCAWLCGLGPRLANTAEHPVARAEAQGPATPAGGDAGKDQEPKPKPRASWNPDFELLVRFEISRPEGDTRRYRRPYVAIWIEDKDGLPVRTLLLWVQAGGPGPRWIPELRRWYRGDQVRRLADDTNLVDTVARPTRMPGKYSVVWDGLDDHGQPLAAGEYTVCIEAAREHGTYQILRKSLKLEDRPIVEELKGNVEIKSAYLAFRRKASAR